MSLSGNTNYHARPIVGGKKQSISVRLVLATLLYSFFIAAFVSAIQIYISYRQFVQNTHERFSQIEAAYLPNIVSGLWEVNNVRVDDSLNGVAQLSNVGRVVLTDELGKKWFRNDGQVGRVIDTKKFPLFYREGNFYFPVGSLEVELTDKNILVRLSERALAISITSVLTLLLGAIFILMLFRQWVTRHLETMARFAEELDLQNLDVLLTLHRKPTVAADELDLVVNSINQMQATLKNDLALREAIEQELRDHKENLEQLVQQRTLALEAKTNLLEIQSQELEVQNRELDAYAHSVAHDLKTPLTTLIGMARLLTSSSLAFTPEQSKKSLDAIYRTAVKMNSIIEALLLLASVRRASDVNPEIVDMKKIAEEACVRLVDLAQQQGAIISFVGEWENAVGHEQWIEEVWVNYLSNAIKYGGTPPIIELGSVLLSNNMVKYWVRDHGAGISAAKRSELFIQFSRLEPLVSEGHGLGLSIVKRIIHRLQGEVGYEDAEGGGSCFWFTLPYASCPL